MIVDPDAVVDPGTVMVEALDTLVADTAVTRSIRPYNFTVSAQQDWIEDLHHVHEQYTFRPLEVARVLAEADAVEEHRECEDRKLRVDER